MTTDVATFSVRSLVREVVESSDLTDPADIASKVAEQITASNRKDALAQILPAYVQAVISSLRSAARPPPEPRAGTSRADQIRNWHQRWLHQPLCVRGEWKHVGECTASDLSAVANERRYLAARNERIAGEFEAIAKQMHQLGVEHVHDLPADVIDRIVRAET